MFTAAASSGLEEKPDDIIRGLLNAIRQQLFFF